MEPEEDKQRDPVVRSIIDEAIEEEQQEKKKRKTGKSVKFSQVDTVHQFEASEEVCKIEYNSSSSSLLPAHCVLTCTVRPGSQVKQLLSGFSSLPSPYAAGIGCTPALTAAQPCSLRWQLHC